MVCSFRALSDPCNCVWTRQDLPLALLRGQHCFCSHASFLFTIQMSEQERMCERGNKTNHTSPYEQDYYWVYSTPVLGNLQHATTFNFKFKNYCCNRKYLFFQMQHAKKGHFCPRSPGPSWPCPASQGQETPGYVTWLNSPLDSTPEAITLTDLCTTKVRVH